MTKREDTIEMSVGGLTLDPVTKTPIVILKDTENKLNLPIWIGLLEATAMATESFFRDAASFGYMGCKTNQRHRFLARRPRLELPAFR